MVRSRVEILRAACCIAGIDKKICDREMAVLKHLAKNIGVGELSLKSMVDRANTDSTFFKEQFEIVKTEADDTIKTLVQVAMLDGVIKQEERLVLFEFARRLEMADARFEQIIAAAQKKLETDAATSQRS